MLKKLAKRINKELAQAEDYCTQAMLVKHESAATADLFVTLANEEIVHAEKLLREGHRLIDDKSLVSYEKDTTKTEADHEKCKAIWEWESRIAYECIAEIKYKLSQYRGI